jgi:two-component system chemotaxis sensor kinase CheA
LVEINEIFRVAHTLKGMAGTMGFSKTANMTHEMESLLHSIRSKEVNINQDILDSLFECLDALESYLEDIIEYGKEGEKEFTALVKKLVGFLGNEAKEETPKTKEEIINQAQIKEFNKDIMLNVYDINIIKKAKELKQNILQISVILNRGCMLKSARAFILFQTIERYGDIIKSVPEVQDIEDEKFDLDINLIVVSEKEKEVFIKDISKIPEIDTVYVNELDIPESTIESLNGSESEDMQELSEKTMEEVAMEQNATTQPSSDTDDSKSSKPKAGKTVRVDIERLDVLMNLVSELIIIKTRLEGIEDVDSSTQYHEAVEYLERITTNLHDAVMKVRMVPVEMVFNRFPRMIRDVAKEINKQINLHMSGEETELDRTVIDEIGEPLIHLLRNSADHGLESTEGRVKAKKPEEGNIYLRAYQDGNNVVIEVEDDGGGINLEKVKKKAINNGILSQEAANTLNKKDIIDLLFRPSFSTADVVTGLSGRGVGLDVVKIKIEALGGVVEVETEEGKGSKFTIRLPLTLAIIQALLVFVGKEKIAIPLNSIKEIIKIGDNDIRQVQHQDVILLRDTIVPIVRLDEVLEVPKDDKAENHNKKVVIVKKGDKLVGFVVDELVGQQEIVIKSLGKLLEGIKIIAGATILGDGNVALIIDVNSLA